MSKTNQDKGTPKPQRVELPLDERMAFSLTEAARLIGVSYTTAFRLCQRGQLKSSGALRKKLISRWELERFLKA